MDNRALNKDLLITLPLYLSNAQICTITKMHLSMQMLLLPKHHDTTRLCSINGKSFFSSNTDQLHLSL